MKVSLNWLREYISINETPEKIAEILTDLGLEVEGIETIGGVQGNLEGVVVGEVVVCERHPDADKLSLTKVNIGKEALLQIVCGAPNVRQGQKVPVALVGTTLYPKEGNPIKLKKGKIRGQESEGMICAEDELGIGTSHEGILVLPNETPVGKPLNQVIDLDKDVVFEIGLTPNRSDATCHLGVARDVAARLQVAGGTEGGLCLPDVSAFKVDNQSLSIEVSVENTEACPRYSGVSIAGVTVGESPEWLRKRLTAIGVNSINNVVDATNFVLHELGQPLHAFDLDKIEGRKIIVKNVSAGTKFQSLKKNERGEYLTLTLSAEDLMICDANGLGMCVAGVIGNPTEGVSEATKNIFLESAHFQGRSIRRTSTRHNTRTDAAKVFEKGSDPNITLYALKRAALLIQAVAGGEIASEVTDIYPNPIEKVAVAVRFQKVNSLIGKDLSIETIKHILAALDMTILSEDTEGVVVAVPTNKADVTREADVIEEILRIYGFNNVEMPIQIRSAIVKTEQPDPVKLANLVANLLASNGFNEMMAMSLTRSKYFSEILELPKENLVYINNTSTVELDVMRPTMLTSALEVVTHNQNRQSADLRLFEMGKTYHNNNGKYEEKSHLTLTMVGAKTSENWHSKTDKTNFYTLKMYVNLLLERLGLSGYQETVVENNPIFAYSLKYHRGNQILVEFGKVRKQLTKGFDVKQDVFFADFQWENLLKAVRNVKVTYNEISKFPTVRRDLALVVPTSVAFAEITQIAQKLAKKLLKSVNLFDIYEDAVRLGEGKKSCSVSFLFEDKEKTLQDKEIDHIMTEFIKMYEAKLGAVIRR